MTMTWQRKEVTRCLWCLLWLALAGRVVARAQDDPNAQYVVIARHVLQDETRTVAVPVEPLTLRLIITIQSEAGVTWEIIGPHGRVVNLQMPNVSVTSALPNKRVVAFWDVRAGNWGVRLRGTGAASVAVAAQSEVYACCLNLAGRQYQPLEPIPVPVDTTQQATVYASGNQLVAVSYFLVNERAETIVPIAVRQTDDSNPYNFALTFAMPAQPCRVLVRGRDEAGTPFQRIYPPLLMPQSALSASATPETQAPVPPVPEVAVIAADASRFVMGELQIVRAKVLRTADEPLLNAQGEPVGLRFRYTLQFPRTGSYQPLPSLYPERIHASYTGALSLRMVRSRVTPLPKDLPESAKQNQQLLFAGRATYEGGVTYEFEVDLVPSFTLWLEAAQQYCLTTKPFTVPGMQEKFAREISSEARLRYRYSINGTDQDGRQVSLTQQTYSPKRWYDSLRNAGAKECP